jgi:hypothetical protein
LKLTQAAATVIPLGQPAFAAILRACPLASASMSTAVLRCIYVSPESSLCGHHYG